MKRLTIDEFGGEIFPFAQLCRWMVVALVVFVTGCAMFRPHSGKVSSKDGSLEEALAGLVPLPFDTSENLSLSERADMEAASAAMASLKEDDLSHFSESGEPLLRAGLTLAFSVRVGDRVEVEPMRLQIMSKGILTLPMIGTVACEGLTLAQFKSLLVERYSTFYRDPEIMLDFLYEPEAVSPWGRVLVQGRVTREGWVNIPPTRNLTVSRAIQISGGYAPSARKSAVIVTRRQLGGHKEVLRVNLDRVGKKGEIERDIKLYPGDVIYVPESVY